MERRAFVIDNHSLYIDGLAHLVESFGYEVQVKRFDSLSATDVLGSDLVVLSGGHAVPIFYDPGAYTEEIRVIRESDCPVVGVCLGAQLIAYSYGAEVCKIDRIKGEVLITPHEGHSLVRGIRSFSGYCNHRWKIRNLPEEFACIATVNDIPEVIVHRERPLVGLQFHPEVSCYSSGLDLAAHIFRRACST